MSCNVFHGLSVSFRSSGSPHFCLVAPLATWSHFCLYNSRVVLLLLLVLRLTKLLARNPVLRQLCPIRPLLLDGLRALASLPTIILLAGFSAQYLVPSQTLWPCTATIPSFFLSLFGYRAPLFGSASAASANSALYGPRRPSSRPSRPSSLALSLRVYLLARPSPR